MEYLLTMTTSGRRACFERTLQTFAARVRPYPTAVYVYDDGHRTKARDYDLLGELGAKTVEVDGKRRRVGFCKATRACFKAAADSGLGWFFHLEDDFEILRSVDLTALAHVLSLERQVTQMALMRDAVNEVEKAAGGLYESRQHEGWKRRGVATANAWLEHRSYFTTNPSLMPTTLARSFDWPVEKHCEGVYGLGLRMAMPDATFGVWGTGTPWVRHIGEREGFGY